MFGVHTVFAMQGGGSEIVYDLSVAPESELDVGQAVRGGVVSGRTAADRAERAFLAGDFAMAVAHASGVPRASPEGLRATRLLVVAHLELDQLKSAVSAAREGVLSFKGVEEQASLLLSIARVYSRAGRYDEARQYLELVSRDSLFFPQASAELVVVADWRVYPGLAWASILQGPLAGEYFEPRVPLVQAEAYVALCRYDDAEVALARAEAEFALLRADLETVPLNEEVRIESGRLVWRPKHEGLRAWLSSDPNLSYALRRVDEASGEQVEGAVSLARGWLRYHMDDAKQQLEAAEQFLLLVRQKVERKKAESPPKAGYPMDRGHGYKKRRVVRVDEPFRGRFRPDRYWQLYRYAGQDQCFDRQSRPIMLD